MIETLHRTGHTGRPAWVVAIMVAAAFGCTSMTPGNPRYQPGRLEFDWPRHPALTTSIRRSTDERLLIDTALLEVKLQDLAITSAVARANGRATPTFSRTMELDQKWRLSKPDDPFSQSSTDATCSRSLALLVEENSDFEEIIVTDSRGFVVCQSRPSAHYFHGDQDWWRECVETGLLSHSRLVFDDSDGTLALSIFAPVLDPSSSMPIGVARAVVRRLAAGGTPVARGGAPDGRSIQAESNLGNVACAGTGDCSRDSLPGNQRLRLPRHSGAGPRAPLRVSCSRTQDSRHRHSGRLRIAITRPRVVPGRVAGWVRRPAHGATVRAPGLVGLERLAEFDWRSARDRRPVLRGVRPRSTSLDPDAGRPPGGSEGSKTTSAGQRPPESLFVVRPNPLLQPFSNARVQNVLGPASISAHSPGQLGLGPQRRALH